MRLRNGSTHISPKIQVIEASYSKRSVLRSIVRAVHFSLKKNGFSRRNVRVSGRSKNLEKIQFFEVDKGNPS